MPLLVFLDLGPSIAGGRGRGKGDWCREGQGAVDDLRDKSVRASRAAIGNEIFSASSGLGQITFYRATDDLANPMRPKREEPGIYVCDRC